MVDAVHAPEKRYMVHGDMLAPDGEVHDQEGSDTDQPDRRIRHIEYAKPGLIRQKRDASKPGWKYQTTDHGACDEDRTCARPPLRTRKRRFAPGCQYLQKDERDENARKNTHAYEGLLFQILPVRSLQHQYERFRPQLKRGGLQRCRP